MKTLIISPHTDDAIFSLGDYIQRLENVTILSVFAGIPNDPVGMMKHVTLRKEHEKACDVLSVDDIINGDFLDDVYQPRPTETRLVDFLNKYIPKYDVIMAPLGIHHPDHIQLREVIKKNHIKIDKYYKDLPYAELYPDEFDKIVENYNFSTFHKIHESVSGLKRKAIECYESQIGNDHIMGELLVTEEIYEHD